MQIKMIQLKINTTTNKMTSVIGHNNCICSIGQEKSKKSMVPYIMNTVLSFQFYSEKNLLIEN